MSACDIARNRLRKIQLAVLPPLLGYKMVSQIRALISSSITPKQLTFNPATEKPPQHNRISNETDPIPQHNLSPQSPAPEAEITRVSQPCVDPVRHENVAFFALHLYQMIEVAARLHHCQRPSRLSRANHAEAEANPERVQRDCIARGRRKEIRV